MRLHSSLGLACLLQYRGTTTASPTEQQPLDHHNHNDVQAVRAELKKAEIIPTVIDDFLPSLILSVRWPNSHANLGNTVKPANLQSQPQVTIHDITNTLTTITTPKKKIPYVITLTDPDAPSRTNPKWSEMCHWIASNMSLSQSTPLALPQLDLAPSKRQTNVHNVVKYKAPAPPEKTGKHRYVFLVFAPRNGSDEALHVSRPEERRHWGTGRIGGGVREWARANGLVPVAGNFLYAEYGG